MKSAICTLFESHYHYGLAVLVNSLYRNGYLGEVYIGFRGELPKWTDESVDNPVLNWKGARTLRVNADLILHFLPVDIDYQFTNYKPGFMLSLFDGPCSSVDAIAYFDPDIIVRGNWDFFETWMSHGVALVHEITNQDMPPTHPIRREWEKVIEMCGEEITRQMYAYINAGFCGVTRDKIPFLHLWNKIMDIGKEHFEFDARNFHFKQNRSDIFFAKDQDALNIAAMCSKSAISEMGPEAMDFVPGGFTMSHAVGAPKPWKKNFLSSSFKGISANTSDKAFWAYADGPVKPYTASQIRAKKMAIAFSVLLGRFYRKN